MIIQSVNTPLARSCLNNSCDKVYFFPLGTKLPIIVVITQIVGTDTGGLYSVPVFIVGLPGDETEHSKACFSGGGVTLGFFGGGGIVSVVLVLGTTGDSSFTPELTGGLQLRQIITSPLPDEILTETHLEWVALLRQTQGFPDGIGESLSWQRCKQQH